MLSRIGRPRSTLSTLRRPHPDVGACVWSMGSDVIENSPSSRPHCKAISKALNATASTPGR